MVRVDFGGRSEETQAAKAKWSSKADREVVVAVLVGRMSRGSHGRTASFVRQGKIR